MMFLLISNIFPNGGNICFADRDCKILVLPPELCLHKSLLFIQNDDSPLMSCIIFVRIRLKPDVYILSIH